MGQINANNTKSLGKTLRIFFAIFGAILIPIIIYITRSILTFVAVYPAYWQFSFYFIGLIVAILVSIIAAILYTLGWRLGFYKLGHTDVSRLLLSIFGASFIAYFAIVLPTGEQAYFQAHKEEFEQQVELIKQGQNISHPRYLGIYHIGIYTVDPSHAIVFNYWADSFKSEYAYVYAEKYSDLDYVITCSASDGSGGIGEIYAALSTNWYLCYRTAF